MASSVELVRRVRFLLVSVPSVVWPAVSRVCASLPNPQPLPNYSSECPANTRHADTPTWRIPTCQGGEDVMFRMKEFLSMRSADSD